MNSAKTRILILGGGYVGTYTALGLQKRLRGRAAEVTLVSPESFMVYQPFLPEAASGNIEPRHVVVPLRPVLKKTTLITGRCTSVDHAVGAATIQPIEGREYAIGYDILVVGLGSISRILPVPGLKEHGIGFKSVSEAIFLRNHVLAQMDAAESTMDPTIRERSLTFAFVGGGYAGVEALAELEDMARYACRYYHRVSRKDMRWLLVEATERILPEISPRLAAYALERLHGRGIEVHLNTRLESAVNGTMSLSNGSEFPADTLVWTTGVRAHPVAARLGLTTDEQGRLVTDEFLRVVGMEGVWAAGDCAAVPDLIKGGFSPPTAQHALRQARRMAANIAASLENKAPQPFRYRNLGSLVSLGRYKGVAEVTGIRLRGFIAWWLHRTYHVAMIPSFNRKIRVLVDWTVALFFRRDVVQFGSLADPRRDITEAIGDDPSP